MLADLTFSQEVLVGVIGGVIGGLVLLYFALFQDKWFNRIKVTRIVNQTQVEVSGLLDLYADLFPEDGSNYSTNELLNFFGDRDGTKQRTHVAVDDYFLVVKVKNRVMGFVFCHYYPNASSGIISYLGIDKSQEVARVDAVDVLLKHLFKLLRGHKIPCDLVVFELQKIERVFGKKQTRGIGRLGAFRKRALDFKSKAYEVCIQYERPKLSLDPKLKEEALTLMYVPLNSSEPLQTLPKLAVIKLLEFIHYFCYADFYAPNDPLFSDFQNYLKKRMVLYERKLPENVALKFR